jgi:simple sugar transport system permease protein
MTHEPAQKPAASDRYTERTFWQRMQRSTATNVGLLYVFLLVAIAVAGLIVPGQLNFYTEGNLSVLSQQIPTVAILAIGAGILMISGEFDLSVTAVFVMSSYLMALALNAWGWPLLPAFLLGLFAGGVVGFVNGLVTLRLKVPSFIATLGTMFIVRGFVRYISISPTTGQPDQIKLNPGEAFQALFSGNIFGPLYAQTVWLLIIGFFAFLLLNRHTLGNHIFAVGGDREAAQKTGIRVDRVKLAAFILCSLLAAFTGIMQAARINMIDSAQTLNGLELYAIAASVIGGVYLFGGRGSVFGMIFGAALLTSIESLLILIRAPGEYMPAFVGAMVILSVIINSNVGAGASARRSAL